jgi:hypothetical protein
MDSRGTDRGNRKEDPTPEVIAAECLLFQATWTPEEKNKRLRVDWRSTFIRCDNQRVEMAVEVYYVHHQNHEILNAA